MKNLEKQFSSLSKFFKNETDRDGVINNILNMLHLNPQGWTQPEKEIVPYLLDQSGLMSIWTKENPFLQRSVADFLLGRKRVMVVGGSPGNGKSLFVTELRKNCEIFSHLDPSLMFPLFFIPWDKILVEFYEAISLHAKTMITPPKGISPPAVISLVSEIITELSLFILRRDNETRLIVEVPLSGNRGEELVYELDRHRQAYEVIILYSPAMESEILERGSRDSETSGQPEAMLQMRANILERMLGHVSLSSKEQEDEVILHYWHMFLMGRYGNIISWNPNHSRDSFEKTRKEFREHNINPDELTPISLLGYIRGQFNTHLSLMSQIEFDYLVEEAIKYR